LRATPASCGRRLQVSLDASPRAHRSPALSASSSGGR
jgi:hypothetical protein